MKKVNGFVILEKNGDILFTKDRDEYLAHTDKGTTSMIFATPWFVLDAIRTRDADIEDLQKAVCEDIKLCKGHNVA